MRTTKIRGHNRIWRSIAKWKSSHLEMDLENLKQIEREYVKIWVHPFSSISLTNSQSPNPRGETKKRILNGLFDIYDHWKIQLDQLNEPYYLKIWIYESRFSKSQVVCAIGKSINLYNETFNTPENLTTFKSDFVGASKNQTINYNWIHRLDVEYMFSTDLGNPEEHQNKKEYLEDKKWFNKRLKKNHTKSVLKDGTEVFVLDMGNVWLVDKK
ncbi:MAG: hypothetical protein ACPGSD_04780 [Flavobacteriales bacterium]